APLRACASRAVVPQEIHRRLPARDHALMIENRTLILPSLLLLAGLYLTAAAIPPVRSARARLATRNRAASMAWPLRSAPQVADARALAGRRRSFPLLAFRGGARRRRRPVDILPSFHPPSVVERYRKVILTR